MSPVTLWTVPVDAWRVQAYSYKVSSSSEFSFVLAENEKLGALLQEYLLNIGTNCAKKSVRKHLEIHLFQECFEFIHSHSSVITQE